MKCQKMIKICTKLVQIVSHELLIVAQWCGNLTWTFDDDKSKVITGFFYKPRVALNFEK